MGIFQILSAIEFIGGRQGALFQFVINHLHVNEFSFHHVNVYSCAQELLGQNRNVETIGIETGKVTSLNVPGYLFATSLKVGQSATSAS